MCPCAHPISTATSRHNLKWAEGSTLALTLSVDVIIIPKGKYAVFGCVRVECTVCSFREVWWGMSWHGSTRTSALSSTSSNRDSSIHTSRIKRRMLWTLSPLVESSTNIVERKCLMAIRGSMEMIFGVLFCNFITNLWVNNVFSLSPW